MIWYNVYDIFVNHKGDWIPDLNNCEEMQPDNPHMIKNQEKINEYINLINKDNTLSDFEKYCATRLMSLDMAVWCKKQHIYNYNRKNYYRTTNYDGSEYVWDPDKNSDGSDKGYLYHYNWAYVYREYSSIPNTLSLDDVGYLYNDDFVIDKSGSQNYMCVSIYRFFTILKEQFGFHIKQSPFDSKALIAYYFSEDNKATLLRSPSNSVEFFENDYDILINKIYESCVKIQKSL